MQGRMAAEFTNKEVVPLGWGGPLSAPHLCAPSICQLTFVAVPAPTDQRLL